MKEKAPYEEKAAKRKAEYEKLMDAYNKNLVSLQAISRIEDISRVLTLIFLQWVQEEGSDESEKSRSEVNDEDEASEEVTIPINNAEFCTLPIVFCLLSYRFLKSFA